MAPSCGLTPSRSGPSNSIFCPTLQQKIKVYSTLYHTHTTTQCDYLPPILLPLVALGPLPCLLNCVEGSVSDVSGRRHRTHPDIFASQGLHDGVHDPDLIPPLEGLYVIARHRVGPHSRVHRWCRNHGPVTVVPRPRHAGDQVVTQSVHHLRKSVRRQGSNHQNVRPLAQFNVKHGVPHLSPSLPLVLLQVNVRSGMKQLGRPLLEVVHELLLGDKVACRLAQDHPDTITS
mmetsp:Transcript_19274/g.40461  ORF Transcript_19274/g.40461 Transcript_19274/m.40461 type:complete len:231 (+) Transcript_19274:1022-1714(+)